MLPTQVNAHRGWWYPPHLDYSFKHSLAWPPVNPTVNPNIAQAATEATAAASHLHLHPTVPTGGIPPYSHTFHGYGRGHRWRGPSRLIWFGIGFGAAAWYYHAKQRREEWYKANTAVTQPWDHNYRPFQAQPHHSIASQVNAPNPALQNQPTTHIRELPRLDRDLEQFPNNIATLPSTTNTTTPTPAPLETETPAIETKHSWRWHRHHRRTQSSPAQAEANVLPSTSLGQNQQDDEMRRMKQAVEEVWEEKRREMGVAKDVAGEKARVYAADKLDRLSAALEILRESLRAESENKSRNDEKIV